MILRLCAWLAATIFAAASHARATTFEPADFPGCHLWVGMVNDHFSRWACATADEALAQLRRGRPFAEVLAGVAARRAEFQKRLTDKDERSRPDLAGVRRPKNDETIWRTRIGYRPMDEIAPETVALIDAVIAMHPALARPWRTLREVAAARVERQRAADRDVREVIAGRRRHTSTRPWLDLPEVTLCHRLLESGNDVVASKFKLENLAPNGLEIAHPTFSVSEALLRDVAARTTRFARREMVNEFGAAMQAYFHAMPYWRGSGAIGRIAFAALYRHVFGRSPRFPSDIDVRAMTSRPRDFVDRYLDHATVAPARPLR